MAIFHMRTHLDISGKRSDPIPAQVLINLRIAEIQVYDGPTANHAEKSRDLVLAGDICTMDPMAFPVQCSRKGGYAIPYRDQVFLIPHVEIGGELKARGKMTVYIQPLIRLRDDKRIVFGAAAGGKLRLGDRIFGLPAISTPVCFFLILSQYEIIVNISA